MHTDILIAEIGSTTTVVNAFTLSPPKFIGQGMAATTVSFDSGGDVRIGLQNAIKDLERNLNLSAPLKYGEMLAASSAAGGLKMCVHGLVYDMTVRAAKEAALGAGAVLKVVTAGKLTDRDVKKVQEQNAGIILVAGGMDYGERETAVFNFTRLAEACPAVPFIYAGNIQNRDEILSVAQQKGVKVYITDNVYPAVDVLNVEPARAIIQDVFEQHITHAPGMGDIKQLVGGKIMPTPGAVMTAARLLYEEIGDLAVFDVGGATTDVHSVSVGSPEIGAMSLAPEPLCKRTVEGDLGVFLNIPHIVEKIGLTELEREFAGAADLIKNAKAIPVTDIERRFIGRLTAAAVATALSRHAGKLTDFYTPAGKKTVATGRDLTAVKYLIATGGALTRLPYGGEILKDVLEPKSSQRLAPREGARVLIDNDYIMASLGVMSAVYPDEALVLLKKSLNIL
ncbi:MAG: GlmL-related ornithine degradation protein [Firmicutes bacterium]|nr:GlmL-related ornithine degradation protein [Bacillota bacterium]